MLTFKAGETWYLVCKLNQDFAILIHVLNFVKV